MHVGAFMLIFVNLTYGESMRSEQLLSLAIPVVFLILLGLESRYFARVFVPIQRWRLIGLGFFVMVLTVGSIAPLLLPMQWLKSNALLDLSAFGMWGFLAGILSTSFFGYWLHRAEHRFDWFWRVSHQLHHSPQRVDMAGAYFAHPVEVLLKVAMATTVSIYLLGLAPMTASAVALFSALISMWQHWNITTPHWLGYLVPRPESHVLHHARHHKVCNYGDLPLWDMVFGTYNNPKTPWQGEVGFDDPHSSRVKDMLLMRDVNLAKKNLSCG